MKLDTGEEIFKASCIGCHGPNGTGQPQTILGFEPPSTFPDFTDCNGSTRERTADWNAIIHEGGPIRGFSEIMPSWKDALTDEQINKVIGFLRSRCEEKGWPLGETESAASALHREGISRRRMGADECNQHERRRAQSKAN